MLGAGYSKLSFHRLDGGNDSRDTKNESRSAACRNQRTDMVGHRERESTLRVPSGSLYTLLHDSRDSSCGGESLKLPATPVSCVL